MYSYTGNNSQVAKLVAAVNSANQNGEVYPVSLIMYNVPVHLFQPVFQKLAIQSLAHKAKDGRKVYIERWKSPTTRRPFKKAVAQGEVLVSEYSSASLKYVMTIAPKVPKNKELSVSFTDNWHMTINGETYLPIAEGDEDHPPGVVGPTPAYRRYKGYDPSDNAMAFFGKKVTSWIESKPARASITLSVGDINIPDEAMPLLDFRSDPDWFECTPAITECGTRLVQAQADVLTAIAEMRETIEGLQSNVLRTAGWIKDLLAHNKSRHESALLGRLSPLFDLGSKRAFDRRIKRLIRKKQKQEAAKRLRIENKYGNHSAGEAGDRLVKHWLDAQYGIQPAVLTINDLLETLQREKRVFQRARVAWTPHFRPQEISGWEILDHSTNTGWVWGKAKSDLSTYLGSLASYGRFNLPLTAWERIPLSFVIDWLFPIGDILSSLRIGDFDKPQITMTRSFKREVNVTMVKETAAATYTVQVTGYVYSRLLTSPGEGILQLGLTPNLNLAWEHWVTAFALSWARLRGTKIQERILK